MELKAGYKQTEVGVIPEEWEVKRFCEIGTLSKGRGLLKEDIKRDGSIPAIPYTSLYTDFSEILDARLIKWFVDEESKTVIIREPCLLFASSSNMEANTGKASAIVGTDSVAIGREVIIFKTSAECTFISYLLSTGPYRKRTLALARGTTIKHVYPATFQAYAIAHPTLTEQRAIAAALRDVDDLLEGLDRLIAKKRDIKQAAMQQLLTGQTRLPGFHDDWKERRLGDFAIMGSGGTPPTSVSKYYGGSIPWVSIADMTNAGKIIEKTEKHLTPLGLICSAAQMFDAGTVLYAMYASLGECSIAGVQVSSSQAILGIRPNKQLDSEYLYYYLSSIKSTVKNLGQQGTQSNLNKGMVQEFRIKLPSIEEQKAIATLLADFDVEIAVLEQRREKTRTLKQGMMQQLLTGKVRIV